MSRLKAILAIGLTLAVLLILPSNVVNDAKAVSVFGPVSLGITGGETGIAVNPTNASNAVIFNPFTNTASQIAMYTRDDGATWHAGTSTTAVPGATSDPDVTVDSSGNFYISGFFNSSNQNVRHYLYKSSDGGVTWNFLSTPVFSSSSVVALPGGGTANVCKSTPGVLLYDFPKIIADRTATSPYKNNLYFLSSLLELNTTATACQNVSTDLATVFRSTDGGATWVGGQAFSRAQFSAFGGEKPVTVTADGAVLITSFVPGSGICISANGGIVVTRSVDGGRTYSSSCIYNNPTTGSVSNPILGVGLGTGDIAAGYGTDSVISVMGCVSSCGTSMAINHFFVLSSANDGATWTTAPVRVDDAQSPDNIQFPLGSPQPTLRPEPGPAVSMSSANGRVDVAWYDHRNGNSTLADVYTSYSNNNGASFATNIRITPQAGCIADRCLTGADDFLGIDSSTRWSYLSYFFPLGGTVAYFARVDLADFSISANPASVTINKGIPSSPTINITLMSMNGFAGTITLTGSPMYSDPTQGPLFRFFPVNITLSSGSSGTSTMHFYVCKSTPDKTYTFTVIGTSGPLVHSSTVKVTVTGNTGGICQL